MSLSQLNHTQQDKHYQTTGGKNYFSTDCSFYQCLNAKKTTGQNIMPWGEGVGVSTNSRRFPSALWEGRSEREGEQSGAGGKCWGTGQFND